MCDSVCENFLSPLRGLLAFHFSHGLRRGLHSCAASRLKIANCSTAKHEAWFSCTYDIRLRLSGATRWAACFLLSQSDSSGFWNCPTQAKIRLEWATCLSQSESSGFWNCPTQAKIGIEWATQVPISLLPGPYSLSPASLAT